MPVEHASVEIDGARLRQLRKEAGLNMTAAALKMGISRPYLSAIERGHRPTVPPARFNSICDVMGVERSELLRKPTVRKPTAAKRVA